MNKLGINNVDCTNRRILLRADLDVEVKHGKIQNMLKVDIAVETIKYALNHDCKSVVIISHMGEPEGMRNVQLTLAPFAEQISILIEKEVTFIDNCVGMEAEEACHDPPHGSVILLENIRFHIEEQGKSKDGMTKADPKKVKKFRQRLRRLGDVYVNDAFSFCGLNHSSLMGQFYEVRVAGLNLRKELAFFQVLLEDPDRPALAIFGGDKLAKRVAVMEKIMEVVDEVIIGGRLAVTFLGANEGMDVGDTPWDGDGAGYVPGIMGKANENDVQVYFPVDFSCGDENTDYDTPPEIVGADEGIESPLQMHDVGPDTSKYFTSIISRAATILWDGEMGDYDNSLYCKGTRELNTAIEKQTQYGAVSICCGENALKICDRFSSTLTMSHVSTGGQTTYDLLSGETLPAIDALSDLEQPCRCHVNKAPSEELVPEF